MKNPYEVLGLAIGAPLAEVKRAYRKLAMTWHPDRNPTHEAEEHFKLLKSAYELILDPERYAAWLAERNGGDGDGAADDEAADAAPAEATSGAPAIDLALTLEEAAFGCLTTVKLSDEKACAQCDGSGQHEHAHSLPCRNCKGVGRIFGERGATVRCGVCGGRGYVRVTPCSACGGSGRRLGTRTLEVRIPPGLLPGESLRLRLSRHDPAAANPGDGDVFLKLALRPHAFFELHGRDLHCEMPVSIFQLLHGGRLEIPTLSGTQEIELAPYPRAGLVRRLPGLGYPGRRGRHAGELQLSLRPVYPLELADADAKMLMRLHRALIADAAERAPELAAWEKRLEERRQD